MTSASRSAKRGSILETVDIPGLSTSPLSAAVVVGDLIFTSGMTGRERSTGNVPPSFEAQAAIALDNLRHVLDAAGGSLDTVLKTTVFLTDPNDFGPMNAAYSAHFAAPAPARSTLIVAALAKKELKFEIEAIARRR